MVSSMLGDQVQQFLDTISATLKLILWILKAKAIGLQESFSGFFGI
jgi:hypothetical protein